MENRPIICASAKYAYNKKSNGVSYEYQTIYKSLKSVYPNAIFIDVYQPLGIENLISHLSSLKVTQRPWVLYIPFLGVIGPEVFGKIRQYADIGIFYLDDTWRQDLVYAYHSYCDWFTTSDPQYHWRYKGFAGSQVRHLPFGYDEISSATYCKPFDQRCLRTEDV